MPSGADWSFWDCARFLRSCSRFVCVCVPAVLFDSYACGLMSRIVACYGISLSFCTLVEKRNLKSMSESMALHFSLPPAYRASAICGRARRFRCSSFFLLPPSCLLGLVCLASFSFLAEFGASVGLRAGAASTPGGFLSLEVSRGQLQPPLLLLFFFLSFLPFFSFFLHLGRKKEEKTERKKGGAETAAGP